jgi:hypothetical protein
MVHSELLAPVGMLAMKDALITWITLKTATM